MVDGLVLLALRGVDLQLAEQRVHAEGAGLVGDDRHDAVAELLVAGQAAQQAGEAHRGADGLRAGAGEQLGEGAVVGQLQRLAGTRRPLRDRAAERLAALHHVLVLDRVFRRAEVRRQVAVERRVGDLVVHVQPVAQDEQLILRHLLDLVGRVAALDVGTERPTLDRLAQDRRRRAGAQVLGGGLVRGVQLAIVVTAAWQVARDPRR